MTNEKARELIITLLDDEHGINDAAYTNIYEFATETQNADVMKATEASNGRWYIGEDDAADLKNIPPNQKYELVNSGI